MPDYYTGTGLRRGEPIALPASDRQRMSEPGGYRADAELVAAVNVSLLLAQPLLLTGEPGTGKTELARSVSAELGLGEPLRFDTKSTSSARDLLYSFDAIGRLQVAQIGEGSRRTVDYIHYNALGLAILRANRREQVEHLLPAGFQHPGPRRSVVLIDEVDKAPRDFPNDLLSELERMSFSISELDNQSVAAPSDMRPIVVITSNSEKQLPDAFLRRCVYYDIPFPDRERLEEIVQARLGAISAAHAELVQTALDLFFLLRESGLRKKPATAELLDWIRALRKQGAEDQENVLRASPRVAAQTLSVLVKFREDLPVARKVVDDWARQLQQGGAGGA